MKIRQKSITGLLILVFIVIISTGCNPKGEATEITQIIPTTTKAPSKTPLPTKTITLTPTETTIPTLEDTATPTSLPGPDFSNAEVFSMGPMENWNFFFTIQIEEEITGEYHAVVDKNKDYKCFMMEDYPNRLYCHGPQVAFNDYVDYELYMDGVDEPVHTDEFFIPAYLPPAK